MIHIGFVNQIKGSKQKITSLTLIYKKNKQLFILSRVPTLAM